MVFAFSRGYYEENTFSPNIPFISLGAIKDGKYLQRIFRMLASIIKIRRNLKAKTGCLFYAMSFDCLLIARLSGLKQGYYEIGDLRQVEGVGRVFAFLERIFLKNILGLVLTSPQFYDEFYKKKGLLPMQKVWIIANKLHSDLADLRPSRKRISQGRIIIGLVGLLRYRCPIELLLQFVQERPESYILECFGDGPLRGLVESYSGENIRYHGSFKNPEKLPEIYAKIDLNYVVYDNASKNVRLAIPNKVFESAFFGVPILCCNGTSVGKMAAEWKIGKMVRIDNKENFTKDMALINKDWLQVCSKNCFGIPTSKLIDDGEAVLREMFGKGGI